MLEISEIFKMAFAESAPTLAVEHQKSDLYYQQLEEEFRKLNDAAQKQVGKKGRKKLLRSEELLNEMQSIDEDFIYIQGMRDCAALLRLFGLL